MAAHAMLSASGAERWLKCTPSAVLESEIPDETSEYAAEGAFAHSLAELKLSRAIANTIKPSEFKSQLAKLKKDPMFNEGMEEYIDHYVSIVSEIFMATKKKCPDTLVQLEQRLDFSEWVPDGFGTGDVVLISDDTVEVIDLKYGKGVPVEAANNPQIRLYGLGAISTYSMLYDFTKVRMTIVQPRLDSISTEEMEVTDLLEWAEKVIRPRAELAAKGEGEMVAGDHCRFCKVRYNCRTRAEKNLELAKYDFQDPKLLGIEEIADILGQVDELQKWVTDVKSYALEQAEKHGVKFPGWKLVEGRSNRIYSDETAVADKLISSGYSEEQIYIKSLLGITAMEKLLRKKKFNELLDGLVIKPTGKPTLVPESDRRPELSTIDSAVSDFGG